MAQKKSFKSALNNPAMQFISIAEEPTQEVAPAKTPKAQKAEPKQAKNATKQQPKAKQEVEPKAKKASAKQETLPLAPEGYKINPMYIEVKSKRVQLVLQPSLFEKVKKLAEKNNDSVNNTIHAILENATNNE